MTQVLVYISSFKIISDYFYGVYCVGVFFIPDWIKQSFVLQKLHKVTWIIAVHILPGHWLDKGWRFGTYHLKISGWAKPMAVTAIKHNKPGGWDKESKTEVM